MRKIINGKRYDTARARLIGEAESGGSVSDMRHWVEALYVTPRSGVYFLAGVGGALTRWCRSVGANAWVGGEGILPLSRAEALEWAEEHLDTETVEAAFGAEIEDA